MYKYRLLYSLVFQLVEFARNLTTLLSAHHLTLPPLAPQIQTSFPSAEEVAQTESDWARQRAQFDQDNCLTPVISNDPSVTSPAIYTPSSGVSVGYTVPGKLGVGMKDLRLDEEEMRREASQLDEAMRVRRMGRV